MNTLLVLSAVFIVFFKQVASGDINVEDPIFKNLPPIFRIDDENACRRDDKLYCKVSVVIQRPVSQSLHWKLIQDTINHPKFYNHNELFHAICVEDFCPQKIVQNSTINLATKLEECYKSNYDYLGLKFQITELICSDIPSHIPVRVFDIVVLITVVLYLILTAFATYKSYVNPHPEQAHIIVKALSLVTNWRKLCSLNDRPDFQKLKFIQGIRFYNMLLVIFCHTLCSYIGGYVANTEYFELVYRNPVRLSLVTLSVFLVQTFFLISAFLLAYHVSQSMETYRGSKLRYVFYTFLNRYLRILPPVFVMICLVNTKWIMGWFEGPLKDVYTDKEMLRCQQNWWTNFLFINNHYDENEMCYFITWYLAADTQLYLVSLVVLLVIWKFPQKRKLVVTSAILIGILIPTLTCYKYGLDIIYRVTPENSKKDNFRSFKFNAIYTSTQTNMASYMVGLALGCFYFYLDKHRKFRKHLHFKWMFLFTVLPFTMISIASQDHSRFVSILLSGLVKPCYALGIGAGILAMSQQKNGMIKRICELKPILFMGNFTYSTYVVQFGLVFYRTAATTKPLFVSDFVLVTSFLQDAILSISCGFLMHILVEMPALQLQKTYIPQIRQLNTKPYSKPNT